MLTLIHRPSCSKSQCLYQYLTDQQIPFVIRDYMEAPLSEAELTDLLTRLELPATAMIRVTDPAFEPFRATTDLQDQKAVIRLIRHHPGLLQRPILTDGTRAVIGRPMQQAVDFIEKYLPSGKDR